MDAVEQRAPEKQRSLGVRWCNARGEEMGLKSVLLLPLVQAAGIAWRNVPR